jgi:hypothetical protein
MVKVEFCLVSLFEEIKKVCIKKWVVENFEELEKCNSFFEAKEYYQNELINIKNDIVRYFVLYNNLWENSYENFLKSECYTGVVTFLSQFGIELDVRMNDDGTNYEYNTETDEENVKFLELLKTISTEISLVIFHNTSLLKKLEGETESNLKSHIKI